MSPIPDNYIAINMIRPDLEVIPAFPPAAGYSLRAYRDGDRETWVRIEQASEPFADLSGQTFDAQFGFNLPAMPRRCRFLVAPDGTDCGTITAWYHPDYLGRPWGRVHWVAITPGHRGLGLSKSITADSLRLMRRLGHRRAMLVTQVPRTAAIKAYLDCGFVPDMTTSDAERAWELVRQAIRHPGLGNG